MDTEETEHSSRERQKFAVKKKPNPTAPETSFLDPHHSDRKLGILFVWLTLNGQGRVTTHSQTSPAPRELKITGSGSSTDRTPEIVRDHGATVVPEEINCRIDHKHGFPVARGEYIAIGDADTTCVLGGNSSENSVCV